MARSVRKRGIINYGLLILTSLLLILCVVLIIMFVNQNAKETFANQSEYESEINNLKQELKQLNEEYEKLKKRNNDTAELAAMREVIAEKENEIMRLQAEINKIEGIEYFDINAQIEIMRQIYELLHNPPIEESKIALYYEDIYNGYKFTYNADTEFDSASLIKLPFTLSIFKNASIEYINTLGVEEPELKYDFAKIFKYSEEFHQKGSGKIIDQPEGTKYTYLELFEYLLKYSDNVAYSILRQEYNVWDMRNYVNSAKLTSMYTTMSNMSAADGGQILKDVYEFTNSSAVYAETMLNSMINSAHTVMIANGVYPDITAHKYGWDTGAYHDMGIVYNENPYVIVFLSNLDKGGTVINEYVQSIVQLIAKLHENFYKIN